MKETVNNAAAAIVFACMTLVAALADDANKGGLVLLAAAIAVAVAGLVTELSWHGILDDWAESYEESKKR